MERFHFLCSRTCGLRPDTLNAKLTEACRRASTAAATCARVDEVEQQENFGRGGSKVKSAPARDCAGAALEFFTGRGNENGAPRVRRRLIVEAKRADRGAIQALSR